MGIVRHGQHRRDGRRIQAPRHIGLTQTHPHVEGLRRRRPGDFQGRDVVVGRIAALAHPAFVQGPVDAEVQRVGVERAGQIGAGLFRCAVVDEAVKADLEGRWVVAAAACVS